jgi:uridine phosphorylase
MMDFFVRETRAVVKGPMAMIRYGTCGGLTLEASAGSVVVANAGSGYVYRDPDAFCACYTGELGENCSVSGSGYRSSQVAPADAQLSALLLGELRAYAEGKPALAISIGEGCNITADSFYSSQGRIDPSFCDDNAGIIGTHTQRYAQVSAV